MFAKESMFHSPMFNSMKYLILFLLFAFSVYAQSPARGVSVKTTVPPPVEVKQEKEKEKEPVKNSSFDDDELDKVFYTYYYLNLPKHLQKEGKDKKKLHTNLVGIFKKEVVKRDRSVTKETIDGISPISIKFKRVTEDSKWMKKIRTELKYIQFTEFMYIVRYQTYMTLILFHLDPELHLQTPSQVEFINVKQTEQIQDLE